MKYDNKKDPFFDPEEFHDDDDDDDEKPKAKDDDKKKHDDDDKKKPAVDHNGEECWTRNWRFELVIVSSIWARVMVSSVWTRNENELVFVLWV